MESEQVKEPLEPAPPTETKDEREEIVAEQQQDPTESDGAHGRYL